MFNFLKQALKILRAGRPVGVKIFPYMEENWTLDADFILDNTHKSTSEAIGRFAYNPNTKELVWGDIGTMHSAMMAHASGNPDEFVRGVYDGYQVYLRWYSANPYATSEDIKVDSFNAWYDTEQMLKENGLPSEMHVERGVTTEMLKEKVDPFYK